MDIKQALLQLDPEDGELWTDDGPNGMDGLPLVDVMKKLTGLKDLTRKQITDANPEFCRGKAKVRNDKDAKENEKENGKEGNEDSKEKPEETKEVAVTKESLDQEIAELTIERDLLDTKIAVLQQRRDFLQQREYHTNQGSSVSNRLAYIKSQNEDRIAKATRAARIQAVIGEDAVGTGKSKLDDVLSKRPGSGSNTRPAPRTPNNPR
ncbi:MAG: hypothetical protein KAR40_06080 [Candidatus Sabulitectum sp.]|nr:hypothetical protein [Candidatus Sabulitectum sp.]